MNDPRQWTLRAMRAATMSMLLVVPLLAVAEDRYPARTIKIIVPIPAGATADTVPRIVAEKLAARWGHPVIIENRPGAATNIGAEAVAKAEPDGYTLLAAPPGPLVINQHLYSQLGFDPSAFVPVTVLAAVPNVLVVRAGISVFSLNELIEFARANPDKLNYASAGAGSTPHLTMEWLKTRAGIAAVHVPYKGLAPALGDLLADQVDMMFDNPGNILRYVKSGKLRALAVGSEKRLAYLPDVPAMSEILPGFVSLTWFAVVAPPKTPMELVAKLSTAINETLRLPDVANKFESLYATPVGGSPAETAAFMRKESEHWRVVIRSAGIKPD